MSAIENKDTIISHKNNTFPTWIDIISIIGVFLVANVLSTLVTTLLVKDGAIPSYGYFIIYVASFGFTLIYSYFFRRRRTKLEPKKNEKPSRKLSIPLILWGIILLISSGIVIEPLLELFPQVWFLSLSNYMRTGMWAVITSIVAAPIFEELLFRGVIQKSITQKYGGLVGVVVGSAVFAIIHFNPVQVVNAMVVGLILGFIYNKTNSLLSVMFIHAVNNAISYFLFIISGEQLVMLRNYIVSDTLYYIVFGIALAVTIFSFVEIFRRLREAKPQIVEPENMGNVEQVKENICEIEDLNNEK